MNKPQLVGAPRRRPRTVPVSAEFLSPKQVADRLGVGVSIVYAACTSGQLRHLKLGHSTIRIKPEWVDAWVESLAR